MRKLAAIMFTDLVGYTALSQKNEALALELLEEHRQLLRPLFTQHNGTEIKTIGDAFLVEFASAVEAARCAVDIQKALTAHTSVVVPERRVQVRIGLHVGDVVFEGDDVLGDGVNIASRIEPLASSGGICVSEDVAHQIENKIDLPLELLGEKELKGIKKPVTVYRLVLPWEQEAGFLRLARLVLRKPLRARWVQAGVMVLLIAAGVVWWWTSERVPSIRPGQITRLAVLPFANLMNDPQQEYFVDGIHDALLTELSRLAALTVISRQSVLRYKGSDKSLGEIARELQAHALIEGSVLRAGDDVRINVQLIEAASDRHLWADIFDRKLENVLALHSDVARAIAN
ncbi:MAG: adenylate/guanylate cyclase domain-containing protein, partial [Candidatus Glassbacteria bacterium]|nr:adenylate/guanylate cyclase domain-containing protein [Candidatus Glassbacteria bacterium]